MSTTFPKTAKRGYSIDQVEEFLEDARRAYSADITEPVAVTAASIRRTAFALQRRGYSPSHVDAALERLEDAFALRERERARRFGASDEHLRAARETAQEIVDRLARPKGHRFDRAAFLVTGYRRDEVDALCDRIFDHLVEGAPLRVEEIRTAAFRPKKGGYREAQVDLLLDATVEVMLAIR